MQVGTDRARPPELQQEVSRGLEGERQVGGPARAQTVVVPLGVVVQHVVDQMDVIREQKTAAAPASAASASHQPPGRPRPG